VGFDGIAEVRSRDGDLGLEAPIVDQFAVLAVFELRPLLGRPRNMTKATRIANTPPITAIALPLWFGSGRPQNPSSGARRRSTNSSVSAAAAATAAIKTASATVTGTGLELPAGCGTAGKRAY
jgi:hypothetical protein